MTIIYVIKYVFNLLSHLKLLKKGNLKYLDTFYQPEQNFKILYKTLRI